MRFGIDALDALRPSVLTALCLLILLVVAVVHYFSHPELSTSIFYVIPIAIGVWYGSRRLGVSLAFLSAITWYFVDAWSGKVYSYSAIAYWNAFVRLAFFQIIVYLLANFRELLRIEAEAAETDALTGALNNRGFYRRAEEEIIRSRRFNHVFSVAYIDLDDFKLVNDTYGHAVGDELLRTVAAVLRTNTRRTDFVARLGGDEFAVLFPETDFAAAEEAVNDVRQDFHAYAMAAGWPVTISVGMITYKIPPVEVGQMLNAADRLMYQVKKQGKNGLLHQTWDETSV